MAALDPLGLSSLYSSATVKTQKKKEKSKTTKSSKGVLFSKVLTDEEQIMESDPLLSPEIAGKTFEDALQFLVDSVYSYGDDLKKNTTPDNFKKYHSALSGFMRFVVKNSYKIEIIKRGSRLRKKQPFQIVQVINSKLDELARGVLSNQRDQIGLLAKIDEINGLVIDVLS
jgi:uncharacterized protein YaaR (DUF327 family)